MLVLSRRPQERIVFPKLGIEVEILNVSGNTVRVGINAPRDVLVLRHEVAEKDAARAAKPVANPSTAPAAAVILPAAAPSAVPQQADAVAASRKWMHQIRNHLNTASLAMQVAQTQMACGEVADADSKLQLAMSQLSALEEALSGGPIADGAAGNGVVQHADPLSTPIQPITSKPKPKACRSELATASAAQPTALVVEDNEEDSALLAAVLRRNGFCVETASDGCHALDYLATHKRPDVVLLDMRMPRCDGPTTISKIRSNPELSGLRVVAVSGSRSSEVGVSTGPQGVDRWFCKPVDPSRLVHELKHDLQVTTKATLK